MEWNSPRFSSSDYDKQNKPGELYLSTPTQFNFKHDELSLSLSKSYLIKLQG